MCPPPPDCPKCSSVPSEKCRESGLGMFDVLGRLDIRPLGNETYPGYVNRTQGIVPVSSSYSPTSLIKLLQRNRLQMSQFSTL
jgi:hypothetical protein